MEPKALTIGQGVDLLKKYPQEYTTRMLALKPISPFFDTDINNVRNLSERALAREVFRMIVENNRDSAINMKEDIGNLTQPGTSIKGLSGVDTARDYKVVRNIDLEVMTDGAIQYFDPNLPIENCYIPFEPDKMIFFEASFLTRLEELAKSEIKALSYGLESIAFATFLRIVDRSKVTPT